MAAHIRKREQAALKSVDDVVSNYANLLALNRLFHEAVLKGDESMIQYCNVEVSNVSEKMKRDLYTLHKAVNELCHPYVYTPAPETN